MGISGLGHMINSAGDFGPMLFGTGERLLLPFGLHHILVALIRFTDAGGTQEVCGQTVSGALTIFQAQLSCPTTHGFSESATRFLSQGKMPAFLGGLPGAALAMYHCARPENRHKIKGLLISGLIACVVGGTTEPLEFLFLFVAPVLYVIHALLTGLGFTVMSVLGVTIGNTDGNIIDFVVFGILHGLSTKWYMVPVVAAIWFVAYVDKRQDKWQYKRHYQDKSGLSFTTSSSVSLSPASISKPRGAIVKLPVQSKKPLPVRRVNQVTTFRQSSKP